MCDVSLDEIKIAVKNDLGTDNFQVADFAIKKASENPLGFLGDHIRIIVNVLIDGKEKQLQYFSKKIPTKMQLHREYAEGTKAFYKEIEMYKTLFDDMERAVSRETRQWRPKCYYARDWDLLIVQDISLQNYYMLPERTLMDYDHVKATIETMAQMHACSIIFEEKLNQGLCETKSPNFEKNSGYWKIKDLYPNLIFECECTDKPGHVGYAFWEVGIIGQIALVDYLPGYTDQQKEAIKKSFPDTVRQVYRMLEPSDKFRNVMIHADLWGNNILFRAGEDGKPEHAIMVDFQMTRYAPPAQDLFMLFHVVQDRAFRNLYEASLTDFFYDCLKKELLLEELEIDSLLPRDEFDESCVFYKKYAVLNQMIYTQLNITPADLCNQFLSTPEMYKKVMYEDRTEILIESFKADQLCRDRTIEAMCEIIEMFHLA